LAKNRHSGEDKTMPLYEDVRPLLGARAATDLNAARLLEMFKKGDEVLGDYSLKGIGDPQMPPRASALGCLSTLEVIGKGWR
jgi:hypothetical protein